MSHLLHTTFPGPSLFYKILESNILFDDLIIDILSVLPPHFGLIYCQKLTLWHGRNLTRKKVQCDLSFIRNNECNVEWCFQGSALQGLFFQSFLIRFDQIIFDGLCKYKCALL